MISITHRNRERNLLGSGFKTSRRLPEFCRLLDCMSPATLAITVWSWQTILALLLIRKSLRQYSNSTVNFAAIIHTPKVASVVKKTQIVRYILCRTHLRFVAKWPGQPCLGVWWRWSFIFILRVASSCQHGRETKTSNYEHTFFIWVQKVTIIR